MKVRAGAEAKTNSFGSATPEGRIRSLIQIQIRIRIETKKLDSEHGFLEKTKKILPTVSVTFDDKTNMLMYL